MSRIKLALSFFSLLFFPFYVYAVDSTFDFTNNNIPQYYNDNNWLNNKIDQINNNANVSEGVSFVFITDMHFYANTGYSAALIRKITENKKISFVINGGDQVRAYGTKDDILDDAKTYANFVKSLNVPVYTVRGNHDYTIQTDKDNYTGYTFTENDIYNLMMGTITDTKINKKSDKLYYYYDDEVNMVRYIFLDVFSKNKGENVPFGLVQNMDNEQINWFLNEAINVDKYKFVIVSHAPVTDKMEYSVKETAYIIYEIEKAINNHSIFSYELNGVKYYKDFRKSRNYVLCHLSGHSHQDRSDTTDNVISIGTTSDAAFHDDTDDSGKMILREKNTINEQAFDVITIDFTNQKISATRVGARNNRSWNYKETTSIFGNVIWKNDDLSNRPNSVNLKLINSENKVVDSIKLVPNDDGNWEYIFNNVPVYDGKSKITYRVIQDDIDGYTTINSNNHITNSYIVKNNSNDDNDKYNDKNTDQMLFDNPQTGERNLLLVSTVLFIILISILVYYSKKIKL